MRVLVLATVIVAAAAWDNKNCNDGQCACVDEAHIAPVEGHLQEQLEVVALSPEGRWKMPEKWNSLTKDQLLQCATCDGMKDNNGEFGKMKKSELDFKKIFYINLDKSGKRKWNIENQLNDQGKAKGIPVQRWRGTEPQEAMKANLNEFSEKGVADYVQKLGDRAKWGTIGTYMTHVRLLQHIKKMDPHGDGVYAVFEDDVNIDPNWKEHIENAFNNNGIPEDWDLLKFGYWGGVRCQDRVTEHAYEARFPQTAANGALLYNGNLGYLVRPKSIPAILEQLKQTEIYDVDGALMSSHKELVARDGHSRKHYGSAGIHTYMLEKSVVFGGLGTDGLGSDRTGGVGTAGRPLSAYNLLQQD